MNAESQDIELEELHKVTGEETADYFLTESEDLQRLIDRELESIEEPTRMSNNVASTVLDAAFNFTNSIVGAGIIGLPYALKQAGVITGTMLLIGLTLLVDHTVLLLVQNGKLSGHTTYQGMTQYCFGKKGFLAISFFQFIFAYGAMCAYTVILGDTIPRVMARIVSKDSIFSLLTSRSFMIVLCTLGVSLPLSLNRDVSALAKASAISLGMILFMIFAVLVSSASLPPEMLGDPKYRWTFIDSGIFQAIGVISFAFVCHHNTFLIFGSLKKPTLDRFAVVTHLSTL